MADRSCLRVTVNMKDVGRAAAILDCAPEHFTKDEEGGGSTFEDEMPVAGMMNCLTWRKRRSRLSPSRATAPASTTPRRHAPRGTAATRVAARHAE